MYWGLGRDQGGIRIRREVEVIEYNRIASKLHQHLGASTVLPKVLHKKINRDELHLTAVCLSHIPWSDDDFSMEFKGIRQWDKVSEVVSEIEDLSRCLCGAGKGGRSRKKSLEKAKSPKLARSGTQQLLLRKPGQSAGQVMLAWLVIVLWVHPRVHC